jgi:perosamine synthetase
MNNFIPVNTPLLSGNELKYITECIETGWISSEGTYITKFETLFAKYVDRDHGIAVSNGSEIWDSTISGLAPV